MVAGTLANAFLPRAVLTHRVTRSSLTRRGVFAHMKAQTAAVAEEPRSPSTRITVRETVEQPDTLTASSDEDLLVRFCQGETEAFGTLVRLYDRELYGYLRRYLDDAALAEDV